jgi:hypothetical protein
MIVQLKMVSARYVFILELSGGARIDEIIDPQLPFLSDFRGTYLPPFNLLPSPAQRIDSHPIRGAAKPDDHAPSELLRVMTLSRC